MSDDIPAKLSSNYPYPWVLVAHGGVTDGQRPRTRLGFIKEPITKDNQIIGFKVLIERSPGRFYETVTRCSPAAVLHEFRGENRLDRPDEKTVQAAKSALPVWRSNAEWSRQGAAKA